MLFSAELLAPTIMLLVPLVAPAEFAAATFSEKLGVAISGADIGADVAYPPVLTIPLFIGTYTTPLAGCCAVLDCAGAAGASG